MCKLTDGKRTVEIRMYVWQDGGYGEDWSADFFDVGCLPTTEDGAYIVKDVGYCIDQAADWKHRRGDYIYEYFPDSNNRYAEYIESTQAGDLAYEL